MTKKYQDWEPVTLEDDVVFKEIDLKSQSSSWVTENRGVSFDELNLLFLSRNSDSKDFYAEVNDEIERMLESKK